MSTRGTNVCVASSAGGRRGSGGNDSLFSAKAVGRMAGGALPPEGAGAVEGTVAGDRSSPVGAAGGSSRPPGEPGASEAGFAPVALGGGAATTSTDEWLPRDRFGNGGSALNGDHLGGHDVFRLRHGNARLSWCAFMR